MECIRILDSLGIVPESKQTDIACQRRITQPRAGAHIAKSLTVVAKAVGKNGFQFFVVGDTVEELLGGGTSQI